MKLFRYYFANRTLLGAVFLLIWQVAMSSGAPVQTTDLPLASHSPDTKEEAKKIFGHYMGCFPLGSGAMTAARYGDAAKNFRHDASIAEVAMGGRYKSWPLLPPKVVLTMEQSADLEIRRAIRAGLDGFAIDAWAGGEVARKTLDALFKAAEAGKYPFEITICLDPSCLPPGEDGYFSAIKYLLEKHGQSPNLAHRNGKVLIFGYSSRGIVLDKPDVYPLDVQSKWPAVTDAYTRLEKRVGCPIFFHFGMEHFYVGANMAKLGMAHDEAEIKLAEFLGKHCDAVGLFTDFSYTALTEKISKAVRSGGAEWAPPISIQYDNITGNLYAPKGTAFLREGYERARRDGASLIQFATWNDYGEHTNLAPTTETGYGFGSLNHYFVDWWKTGKQPQPANDLVYATYRRYPPGAKVFPFQQQRSAPDCFEILTILPRPALIRLPGRADHGQPIEFEAPAGLYVKQYPVTPGPIIVEVVRNGKIETAIRNGEPVTDRPYREDNTLACSSTEDEKYWEEDFPGVPYPREYEYADDDADGLPNWFEMYWFGKWNDYSTATIADPSADPNGAGKNNLQAYLDQTDPTKPKTVYHPSYIWDIAEIRQRNSTFNPDRDALGTLVWHYMERKTGSQYTHIPRAWMRDLGYYGAASIRWKEDGKDDPQHPKLHLRGRVDSDAVLAWESPVDGVVDIEWQVAPVQTSDGATLRIVLSPQEKNLWDHTFYQGDTAHDYLREIKVHVGDKIYFEQSAKPGLDAHEDLALSILRFTLKRTDLNN